MCYPPPIGLKLIERRCSGSKEDNLRSVKSLAPVEIEPRKQPGCVRRKNGSKKLYVDFYYNGVRVLKSTYLDDTPKNRETAQTWLDRQLEKIDKGTFRFAEVFPGASNEEKEFHASKEGWDFSPEPTEVLFREYAQSWRKRILDKDPSEGKRRDYEQVIDTWLMDYFGDKSFHWITGVRLREFVSALKWRVGKNAGKALSPSRIRNIMIPLRTIWSDACEEHGWDLSDPFKFVAKRIPKVRKKQPEVFRYAEWQRVLAAIDPYYVPHAEVMVLTGLSASELAGLRKDDITANYMMIQNSIVRGNEKDTLKTEYRIRRIPITKAIRSRLDAVMKATEGNYVFPMKSGITFREGAFRNNVWTPALKKAGVAYKKPYTTRHVFTAWSLIIGKSKEKLVRLMGHGSREMVDRVYGHYLEGLEEDAVSILGYFGLDFVEEERKLATRILSLTGESTGESPRTADANTLIS